MPSEGVVDALLKVHRALRPDGLVLDCHPVPEPVLLEVRQGSKTAQMDLLEYTPEFSQAIANADQAYSTLCSEGIFVEQQALQYEVLVHFDSFDDWLKFWADEAVYFVPPRDEFSEKMQHLLAARAAELLFHCRTKAACFKKPV